MVSLKHKLNKQEGSRKPLDRNMSINELMLLVFIINLPFGYMRSKATRFSRQWMMAIHIPVPFVFLLRIFSGLNWTVIPLLLLSNIAGQLAGGRLGKRDMQ